MVEFLINSGWQWIGDLHIFAMIQKRLPVILDNQVARRIQSESIRGMGAEHPVVGAGAKPPQNGELRGAEPP